MKKLVVLFAITAFTATAVMAQEQQQPKDPASHEKMKQDKAAWEKKMKEELKLTADQSAKYDALSKEYGEKMTAISQDASLNDDAKKEKKMALRKEKEAKFLEILTPEQQATYKELMEKKKSGKP